MNADLFPPAVLAEIVRELPEPENDRPFFVMAYYPAGGWWKITGLMEEAETKKEAAAFLEKGWAHVKICRIPNNPTP